MAGPSVTHTFANSTTADATQVNTNFTDLINGMTDGTKDFSINALTCAGAATLNGNVNLGNATADDLTITASLASTLGIKTTNSYDIGAATIGLRSVYFGSSGGAFSTRLIGGAAGASWTMTLPTAVPAGASYVLESTTGGATSWTSRTKLATTSKTTAYTATAADDTIYVSAAGGSWTLTLPAAAGVTGKVLQVVRTDSTLANQVTIDPNSTETINGATTVALYTQYEMFEIQSDGTNWIILNHRSDTPWATASTTIGATTSAPTKGTGVRDNFYWRRAGDTIQIRYDYEQSSAGAAGTGTYLFPLPNSWAADTAKISVSTGNEHTVGHGHVANTSDGLASANRPANVSLYNSTNLAIAVWNTPAADQFTLVGSGTFPLSSANLIFTFHAAIPVSGWTA